MKDSKKRTKVIIKLFVSEFDNIESYNETNLEKEHGWIIGGDSNSFVIKSNKKCSTYIWKYIILLNYIRKYKF